MYNLSKKFGPKHYLMSMWHLENLKILIMGIFSCQIVHVLDFVDCQTSKQLMAFGKICN